MDALLLLAPAATSIGYAGRGDFTMAPDGRLQRRAEREVAPFVYAGAAILLARAVQGRAGRRLLADDAVRPGRRGEGRLHGLRLDGVWMHVGTPGRHRAGRGRDHGQRGVNARLALSTAALICGDSAAPHRPHAPGDDTMRTAMATAPRVFTIPASAPFLPTLIAALMEDRLVLGLSGPARSAGAGGGDASICRPGAPAGWRSRSFLDVLGATPRSCRASCRSAMSTRTRSCSPKPRPATIAGDALDLPDALERARAQGAAGATDPANGPQRPEMRGDGNLSLVANSPAAALALAGDLARLMDDMMTRQVPWDRLDELVPDDIDEYWQNTLRFLKIAREQWPAILAERGTHRAGRAPRPADRCGGRAARDSTRAGDRRRLHRLDAGDRDAARDHRRACRTARWCCPGSTPISTTRPGT